MAFQYRSEKGTVYLPSGNHVIDPHYVDYEDGVGWQLCGGEMYDKDGKHIGHCDPPGIKGYMGVSGYSGYSGK